MPHPSQDDPDEQDHDNADGDGFSLPVEVEVIILPDGSVVFADLEEGTLPIAAALDSDYQPDDSDGDSGDD